MKAINYLDWIEELDSRFKVRQIVQEHFVSIAHSQNALADNIKKLIDREVNGSPQCMFLSRIMELCVDCLIVAHTTLL